MEIMERLAHIKIIFTIVVTLLVANCSSAQHQIDKDITFSFKGKNNYVPLNTFLAYYKFDHEDLPKCMTASGVFKFQVTPIGKIASIDVEGDLPEDLIKLIKERIMLTEEHWVFSDSILKSGKNIEFYYPFYMEISLLEDCKTNVHESQGLLIKLFSDQKILHVRDEIYFIAPGFSGTIR
ncbi:hypothetical protein [Flavobacterium sp. FlaQc-48]|uniref:hypothetical protein n=1 Tax=Flavobacterium sp. FlaQc-48 TaxID=3374181 RepID=UPI003756DE5A